MRVASLAAAVLALVSAPEAFRWTRPISAPAGWVRLTLPDDVLDACRPGLPDLRVVDGSGKEVAYAFAAATEDAEGALPIQNLEVVEKRETVGEIDRGPSPALADAVTFEIAGTDFLKPVRLEASDDRATWRDLAKGSIFAAGDVRVSTLGFPPNDRRHLRFRLDDRNGAAVRPLSVRVRAPAEKPPVERPLAGGRLENRGDGTSGYGVSLPAANLGVTGLRLQSRTPAFSRSVRVYERVLYRDEVHRRLVAEARIERTPGSVAPVDVRIEPPTGRNLELEVDDGDSPQLEGLEVSALVRPRSIDFFAAEGASLRLLYGSAAAAAPRYDLARAVASGKAPEAAATVGAPTAREAEASATASPPRTKLADPERWTVRRPIHLPERGTVAYLDLVDRPGMLGTLRLVDEGGGQVPYVVENGAHEHRRALHWESAVEGSRTVLRLIDPGDADAAEAVELVASDPDYFSREVRVVERRRDARGPTDARTLGAARWEKEPGDAPARLRLPIQRPENVRSALSVEVENGDNPPIRISEARLATSAVRIDFPFRAGERLFLLSGNPEAAPPSYDLQVIASAVAAAPAEAASLGLALEKRPEHEPLGRWLWAAIVIAGLALLVELSRTLRRAA